MLWLMRAVGLFDLARWITSQRAFVIIGWHGVSIDGEHESFSNLFISPNTLRRRLAYLKKHYKVVPLASALEQHEAAAIEPRQVVLTFDDGYHNFQMAAVPILREFGVRATAYIVTSHMLSSEPIYHQLIEHLVLLTNRNEVHVDFADLKSPHPLFTDADRRALIDAARTHVHQLQEKDTNVLPFLESFACDLKVNLKPLLENRIWETMTPDDIRSLADDGFAMELHSHTHLNVVDHRREVPEELRLCRSLLENVTGRTCRHFCYPSGRWDREIWSILKDQGIRSAVTTRNGPNFAKTPRLALRRIMNGEAHSQLEFEFEVSGLSWLLRLIRHPERLYAPSEKHASYTESPVGF